MRVKIKPGKALGEITLPTSKSMAHRLLICAALCDGASIVRGVTPCEDVLATVDCLRALGANIEICGDTYTVFGRDMKTVAPKKPLFCRESGSTLRFMIPIAALSGAKVTIAGAEKLLSRPLSVYETLFRERELLLQRYGSFIFVDGPLPAGEYSLPGNVSSQFITGLLFALPLLDSDSVIKILPPFESRPYVDLTVSALAKFGVKVFFEDDLTIKIPGAQKYVPADVTVEADYSAGAFIDALNVLGSDVEALGLDEKSLQGDRVYKEIFPKIKSGFTVLDISDCPDLAPILFTLAAANHGAEFFGTKRLKIKESDRAEVMASELSKFGADIEIYENSVKVKKTELHSPKEILLGHNDHRVVMSLAVLSTVFGGIIDGAEAVSKSYPSFFEDMKNAGIEVELYD